METLEQIRARLLLAYPTTQITFVTNPGPAAEHSLLLEATHAVEIARWLRDDSTLRLDYCSNATGVDWPDKTITDVTTTAEPDPAGGPAKTVETKTTRLQPGYLEAIYHLYSIALKQGPVVIRLRTANRTDAVTLPSLTPIWRSCDFQEREIFDLYGIIFSGHPDLRRLLMWDEFKDHPMRKDYVEPDDYEWEPTAHGAVLERAKPHQSAAAAPAPKTGGTP